MPRPSLLRRLFRSDRGATLVEFAILLPFLILLFAVIVEGGRIMWSYQTAVAGVRDAARYLGRVVPSDVCAPSQSLPNLNATLLARVRDSVGGTTVMPAQVTVNSLTTAVACTTGDFRVPQVGVASVTAQVTIALPFRALLEVMGADFPDSVTTTITDRTRVFGA